MRDRGETCTDMGEMLTVLTLLKVKPSPNGEQHGERPFWREFGPQYLNVWLANARKYIPQPHQIVVMTDSPKLVSVGNGIGVALLDSTIDAPGFWAKLNMFRVGQGKCLYLDLDNVVCGPLDELCALEPDPLIMMDDRRVPRLPNGSAILFDAERCRGIWAQYAETPRSYERQHVAVGDDYSNAYDQSFIADCYREWGDREPPFFQDLLPRDYCLNAYSELPLAEDWRDSRLIFGCGAAKPHTSTHPAFALR
jgi:hypothetical protein